MAEHKFLAQHTRVIAAVAIGAVIGAGVTGISMAVTAGASEIGGEKVNSQQVKKLIVNTVFVPADAADLATAVTYNPELVPVAAQVQVKEKLRWSGGTRIELGLRHLVPNRTYGAHVHTKPCGKLPTDAGPHYQDKLDPVQPSVDPAYANAKNEVWLDVNTNEDGSARSIATVDWRFRDGGARSVVVHEMATASHAGHAGTAGARLACVNVPFK